ncbi:MAG: hypothetical protein KA250_15310 [Verrucomicrobiales bacterium]|jgi:hypothetical protein|nr:hypothetical protein [Verrucomicrobiales bacterium]
MKLRTKQTLRCIALVLLLHGSGVAQQASPAIPVGSLSAFPTIVQTGTHPQLTWDITVPATVIDVVTVTPPGTVTPKRTLKMDVRVLGASVWASTTNNWGQVTGGYYVPTEALVKYNSTSYSRIFYNTHNNVNPNTIVYTRTVTAGNSINFGGRYYFNNSWSSLYTSTSSSQQVIALVDGDTPPTTTPLYQQPTIQSFILPYLDSTNGKIKLGPRDVIYLMELTHTNKYDGGFDLQDLALLVTFTEI